MHRFALVLLSSVGMHGKGWMIYDTLALQVVVQQVRCREWGEIIVDFLNRDPSIVKPAPMED